MKLRLDCIICFMRQALKASRLVTSDKEVQEKVLRKVMEELLKLDWRYTPPELAHRVHKIVKQVTGVEDPYKEVKKLSNDHALGLFPQLRKIVNESMDPLETAARLSIAGNIIDFAAFDELRIDEALKKVLKQEIAINDYKIFREKTLKSSSLLFFADNAGEIVFDKLLIETMIKLRNKSFEKIIYVVKDEPILNDATLEDVKYVNLLKLPNITFKTIPVRGEKECSMVISEWFKESDFIIAKGQGNYERFSDYSNVFFLLMVKCPTLAEDLHVNVGDIILKYNS